MNFLDIRTIIFLSVITYIVCALFAVQLWRQSHNRFAGMAFWVFNFALQAVALVLFVLRGAIPDWISIVLANTIILAGMVAGYMGLERFFEKKGPQIQNYVLIALYAGAYAYATFIHPDLHLRTLIMSVAMLIIFFQYLWLLWHRVEAAMRPQTFGVGMVFAGYCVLSIVRIFQYFVGAHPGGSFLQSGAFQALVLACYLILLILLVYNLVLMVNKRLIMEIGTEEEKFSKAFHSAPYAITLIRLSDGTVADVNKGFASITGYDRDEVLGKKTIDLRLWEDGEDRPAFAEALSKNDKVNGLELRLRKKTGEVITGLLSAEIIMINGKKNILSSFEDITERKRVEEEIQVLARFPSENPDPVLRIDRNGTLLYANKAGLDRLPEWHLQEGQVVPSMLRDVVSEALNSGTARLVDLEHGKRTYAFSVTPVTEAAYANLYGRDITDRKRAEETLKNSEKRYRELSIVDDLTQLYNSRHFYVQLQVELKRANRYKQPLTLLMLDLDHFKKFNDTYGHIEGDQVLRRFGQVAKRCLRETDIAYRYGGEEFTILMPMTTSKDGAVIAERIRTEFKEETFSPVPGQDVHMTVSIGLAQYKPQEEMKAFVHRVDQLMYQCKENGRDQVCWEP